MGWVTLVLSVTLAACFSPTPPAGAPCGPGDVCPSGLVCSGGLCVTDGVDPDGPGPDGMELPGAWAHVASGHGHSCAIDSEGGLWCWGDNGAGNLGLGDVTIRETARPRRVGTALWQGISCEGQSCCGVQADASAWCWGSNVDGQLGRDYQDLAVAFEPMPVPGTWTKLSLGGLSTCGIDAEGTLACWGNNAFGQLGNGTTVSTPMPQVLDGPWVDVSAGLSSTCGVRADGTLWCWGDNSYGQLGDGTMGAGRPFPIRVFLESVAQVSVGYISACARTVDGRVYCWGANNFGQLGNVAPATSAMPRLVEGGPWTDLVVGGFQVCALEPTGTMWCWGNDSYGQLAFDGAMANPKPTRASVSGLVAALEDFGLLASCVVTREGAIECTGYDALGGLGTGAGGSIPTPHQVPGAYTRIATASNSTCAVTATSGLACWGANDSLPYAGAETTTAQVPLIVRTEDVVGVALGDQFHLELRDTGDVYCTGQNQHHECGDVIGAQSTPVRVEKVSARAISASGHACALPEQGEGLTCWGKNDEGQLGVGDRVTHASPVRSLVTVNLIAVAAGFAHTCSVSRTGDMYCVGGGEHGQLGGGELSDKLDHVLVEGKWTGVTAGYAHTCGLDAERGLWCWGDNTSGQLGIGSMTTETVPRPVMAGTEFAAVSAGANHTCAIDSAGQLWCWGFNVRGELGDGTFAPRTTPVRVGTAADWTAIAAGTAFTCGLRTTELACWGTNQTGQLGSGTAWRGSWEPL